MSCSSTCARAAHASRSSFVRRRPSFSSSRPSMAAPAGSASPSSVPAAACVPTPPSRPAPAKPAPVSALALEPAMVAPLQLAAAADASRRPAGLNRPCRREPSPSSGCPSFSSVPEPALPARRAATAAYLGLAPPEPDLRRCCF
ncbi:hypothetical protein VPH35_028942 [Triticum aestivum]